MGLPGHPRQLRMTRTHLSMADWIMYGQMLAGDHPGPDDGSAAVPKAGCEERLQKGALICVPYTD